MLALGIRLILPSYLQLYVNEALGSSREYAGRIGPIELSLWRGAYRIHDLRVVRNTNAVPIPFFQCRLVEVSVDWNALVHGKARGKIVMDHPQLNFVDGPSAEDTQTGDGQPWLNMLSDLFPFRLDKADIIGGDIHFRAYHKRPPVDIYLTNVQASISNLTNVKNTLDPLIATVTATGTAMESGRFKFDMALDPGSYRPNFSLSTQLIDLDVKRLNPLTRAYGDFDFEQGRFDFVAEVTTKDGFLEGYAKPLFRNLRVASLRDLEKGGPIQFLWESAIGLLGRVFRNQPRQQFGTRITIEGNFDNPRTSILEIVGNVLRNAFVQAYLPRLEGRVAPKVVNRQGRAGSLERNDQ